MIIGGKRACGKTTELIKMANKEKLYIICADRIRQEVIIKNAEAMDLIIPYPITVDELPLKSPFIKEVLIDDVEDVLLRIINKPIKMMSTSLEIKKLQPGDLAKAEHLGDKTPDILLEKLNSEMRKKFGKLKGHYKWDLAVEWFQTSNDMFFEKYGFNFVPKEKLFDEAKEYVFTKGNKNITNNINIGIPNLISEDIFKEISKKMSNINLNRMKF